MSVATKLLERAQLVLSGGDKPFSERRIANLIVKGALVLPILVAGGQAPEAQAQQYQSSSQQQHYDLSQRIPAEVVSVERIRPTQYEREQERLRRRSQRATERVVDRLIGSFISNHVDRDLRSTARDFANIATDMTGNRISEWRGNESQIRSSDERVMVTVDVRLPGRAAHRFEIPQSAAVNVRRGDKVYLMPTTNGGVVIVPDTYGNSYSQRARVR